MAVAKLIFMRVSTSLFLSLIFFQTLKKFIIAIKKFVRLIQFLFFYWKMPKLFCIDIKMSIAREKNLGKNGSFMNIYVLFHTHIYIGIRIITYSICVIVVATSNSLDSICNYILHTLILGMGRVKTRPEIWPDPRPFGPTRPDPSNFLKNPSNPK